MNYETSSQPEEHKKEKKKKTLNHVGNLNIPTGL